MTALSARPHYFADDEVEVRANDRVVVAASPPRATVLPFAPGRHAAA